MTVRLKTHDCDEFSEHDITRARQISAVAWELDMPADPTAVQTVQVSIDAHVSADVQPFWCARSDTEKWGPRT